MMFHNRSHAANLLVQELAAHRGQGPLVLGIPGGGVPMARHIADALGADLDVVLVRKIGHPSSKEVAIGAIGEDGEVRLGPGAAGVSTAYVDAEAARQFSRIARMRALLTPSHAAVDVRGRTCIVVDDGAATGHTMLAAVHSLHARGAKRVVAALPVASVEAYWLLASVADDVVCLHAPEGFHSVGHFYEDFRPVRDDEVAAALGSSEARVTA
ncbi:MAG: phosphoribosyltransferase family protein [Acidobacteriota bacterium]